MSTQWILSYGTLVNKRITEKTGDSFRYIPCRIHNYIRRWTFAVEEEHRSAAGIEQREGAHTTGMLVEVPENQLPQFDIRETGYSRVKVDDTTIIETLGESLPAGEFWLYIPDSPQVPTEHTPITQTMVDAMVEGYLHIHEDLAKEAIRTTVDWECPWVNDRSNPLYPRYLEQCDTKHIDALLHEVIPMHFAQRKEV